MVPLGTGEDHYDYALKDILFKTFATMESGVFLPCLDQFMMSPLVTWVSKQLLVCTTEG